MKKKIVITFLQLLLLFTLTIGIGCQRGTEQPKQPEQTQKQEEQHKKATGTDHSKLISGTFTTGPEVTAKCLSCHNTEGQQVMQTIHWNWAGPTSQIVGQENRTDLGKRNGINNFCTSVPTNEVLCMQCHPGYGTKYDDPKNIDCLVCHAREGNYAKKDANELAEDVNLLAAAQSVGRPTRANCGACHFYAGGGDAVKQGDLDSTLVDPPREHDIHMGGNKNMDCVECHGASDNNPHAIIGQSIHAMPSEGRLTCAGCHKEKPHKNNDTLNKHTDRVACQTCHIPTFSKALPTKMFWNWETAGQNIEEPKKDKFGKETFLKKKGHFTWDQNVVPTYAWYNGKVERYLVGDQINKNGVTTLAKPVGSKEDSTSKIYPFKLFTGKQPADSQKGYLLPPNLQGGFWKDFDWNKALAKGAEAFGIEFSGQYKFVPTEMYIGINHEVVPKEKALECSNCHGDKGVLDWQKLGYEGDPRD